MRAKHAIVFLALLLATSVAVYAADFYTPPVVSVPAIAAAPVVDGKIEPQEWRGAAVLSDFITLGGEALPALPTTVYLCYDEQALYVGAKLFDPQPNQLRTEVTERDGEVWRDDCLELFMDTVGERKNYAHLVVNPLGTRYDSFDRVVTEDFQWHVATSVDEDGWGVEIILPFANQITPQPGDQWIIAVGRNAVRTDELSAWTRHDKSFHEPQNFGILIFGELPYRVTIDDIGARWLGDNSAFLSVMPPFSPSSPSTASDVSEWVKLNVRVMGRDKRGHFFKSIKCPISSPFAEQVMVPYSVKQDGFSTVTFSLTDHEGVVRWRSGPYPVNVPAISAALHEAEQKLGRTLVAWARMLDGDDKQLAQAVLEDLLESWRYLGQRYLGREELARPELVSLLLQARLITQRTDALLAEITGEAGE